MTFILTGGDDHALLATFPRKTKLPAGWSVVGSVSEGEGVTVDGARARGTGRAHPLLREPKKKAAPKAAVSEKVSG